MQLPIGYYRKLKQIYINIRNYIKNSFNYIVKIYPYVSSIECMINNTTHKPIQDCEHARSQFVWLGIGNGLSAFDSFLNIMFVSLFLALCFDEMIIGHSFLPNRFESVID